jgi:hypothetical protein
MTSRKTVVLSDSGGWPRSARKNDLRRVLKRSGGPNPVSSSDEEERKIRKQAR